MKSLNLCRTVSLIVLWYLLCYNRKKRRLIREGHGMAFKPLPIGIDDFEEIISHGYYYVDKT